MRALLLPFAVVVCCLSISAAASAQTPAPGSVKPSDRTVEVSVVPDASLDPAPDASMSGEDQTPVVFQAVGNVPEPKPKLQPASPNGIDPRLMVETMTNSVLNAGGDWNPSLGKLTTGDPLIDGYIIAAGLKHGVDPKLIYAVMHQESTFKKNAVSPKGACGYMQLMPATARRFGVTDIFDPQQNIDAGTRYLRFLLDLFDNDVELALAGYNAGEYRVIREGYRVPRIRETQNYVKVITARYYGHASRRKFVVTYGASSLTTKDRDDIQLAALATQDDRGTDSLSNIY